MLGLVLKRLGIFWDELCFIKRETTLLFGWNLILTTICFVLTVINYIIVPLDICVLSYSVEYLGVGVCCWFNYLQVP